VVSVENAFILGDQPITLQTAAQFIDADEFGFGSGHAHKVLSRGTGGQSRLFACLLEAR